MKNLIITLGALLLIISISSYQMMCNNLLRDKIQLKFAADEAAATAALCLQYGEDGDGDLMYDEKRSIEEGEKILSLNLKEKDVKSEFVFISDNERHKVIVTIRSDRFKVVSEYEYL